MNYPFNITCRQWLLLALGLLAIGITSPLSAQTTYRIIPTQAWHQLMQRRAPVQKPGASGGLTRHRLVFGFAFTSCCKKRAISPRLVGGLILTTCCLMKTA